MDDATTLDDLIAQDTTPDDGAPDDTDGQQHPAADAASEIDTLRARLAASDAAQAATLARLRETLLDRDPAIDAAMVTGETLEELEASFTAALAVVERVRESVRRERAALIPAGAPGRNAPAPKTAIEKIRKGLAGR